MSESLDTSMSLTKSKSKKIRIKSPRETPTTSLRESPTNSVLEELLTSSLCNEESMKHIESEIRLQNDRNLRNYCLQNYDSRFWPLLSFLETDFLLQIEKIMFYGWNNDYVKGDAALIVTKDKNVYGFGNNKGSQLGVINIGIPCTLTPQKVNALCQKGIKIMVCTNDLCLFVLTEEGKIYSWGDNKDGKLGHGIMNKCGVFDSLTIVSEPIEVVGLADKYVIDIKCGFFHVLVLTNDGKMYSWGGNNYRQVIDTNDQVIQMPMEVIIRDESGKKHYVQSISCGSVFNMALTFENILYSWGGNMYGQLGLGNNSIIMYGTPMKIVTEYAIAKVECGYNHTLALTKEGLVYVWGLNDEGQLGIKCLQDVHIPVLIDQKKMGKVLDIATRFNSKKSAVMIENNCIYIWGSHAHLNILNPTLVNYNNIQDAFIPNINMLDKPCLSESEKQSNIAKCLETAFNNSTSADVKFIVDEQSIHIHRTIIMLRCPKMYETIFANNSDTIITRNEFSAVLYKAFFKYLYTDTIDLPYEKILELHNLAVFYDDNILAKNCIRMIKENINITNVSHFYGTAVLLKIKELEEFCFKYAFNNMTAVVKTDSYAKLPGNVRLDFIIKAAEAGIFKN